MEHHERSGIWIDQVPNRHGGVIFGESWRVTVPRAYTGKPRVRRQFRSLANAERFAEDAVEGWKQRGSDFFTL